MQHFIALIPAIIVALGILLGSAISARLEESGWWVMLGPLVLVMAMVMASVVDQKRRGASLKHVGIAAVTGVIYLAAVGIIGLRDLGRVPQVVPLLGAGAVVLLGSWGTRAQAKREDERCR